MDDIANATMGLISTTDSSVEHVTSRRYPDKLLQEFARLKTICEEKMETDPPTDLDGPFCGRMVDKWGGCWPDTPANGTASISCPPIPSLKTHENAFGQCTSNGTWFVNPSTGVTFFDYRDCFSKADLLEDDTKSIYIFIGGCSVSLVMLILSLAIFLRFKQLRCDRITIHKHLFLSYILTGISWILYYILVVLNGDVLLENPFWCRALHVICHYFTVCNFFWMFCEGLYLNTVMVYAITSSKKLIIVCYITGWVIPLVLAGIYTVVRNNNPLETEACWFNESNLQFIVLGPIIGSIVMNAAFLINIVRLLITKLGQLPEVAQTKKATRAALLLIPLLGLQYLLLPFRPEEGSKFDKPYHILVALLTSLQGAFVSSVYCFFNGEVITVITRKYKQRKLMRKRSSLKSTQAVGYTSLYQIQNQQLNGSNSINKHRLNGVYIHNPILNSRPLDSEMSEEVECTMLERDSV